MELARYPNCWEPASIERIHLFFTGDRDVALLSYLSGEADVVGGLQNDVTFGATDPRIEKGLVKPVSSSSGVRYLGFNTTPKPFNDPRVRLAMALALDRRALVDDVLGGSESPAQGISSPTISLTPWPSWATRAPWTRHRWTPTVRPRSGR